jgi:hypothetical protein
MALKSCCLNQVVPTSITQLPSGRGPRGPRRCAAHRLGRALHRGFEHGKFRGGRGQLNDLDVAMSVRTGGFTVKNWEFPIEKGYL